jgi:uncharacterized protein (TIGR03437 family)
MTRVKTAALILAAAISSNTRAYAGEADALAISANIQARHLPFGTILDPVFVPADSKQITGYTRCGDSALWTGHYLAAEAFRYQVTRDPQALNNVKNAIAGIKSLADVTGTNVLARCLVPVNSPFASAIRSEEAQNGIYGGKSGDTYFWVGNTSRDQYSGVMFGLAVAYDMVDDAGVQNSISQLVTRLIDFLSGHSWAVVMPDGSVSTVFLDRPDQILSFLQVGRHVNSDHFSFQYDVQRLLLSAATMVPIAFDTTSDSSYFKFNLDYINLYNLVRLESSDFQAIYGQAYGILRNHTAGHQNAFFNLIDRGLNGADASRDGETLALLGAWLERSRRDEKIDLHGVVPVCGDRACQPVAVPIRPPTDFLWQRDPFQLAGRGDGFIESAGIDYILPYWMTRYYAVTSPFAVEPAAAGIASVASGSIASLYGVNLAAAAKEAGAPVLPQSLGGVSLTVRDVAGKALAASLLYVSPGQINFIVPEGLTPGLATFTVSGNAATASVFGTVLNVAPTLFSANGNGTGVAAATAVRIQTEEPGNQEPVPVFECKASGCTGTPIDLRADTTVYLTLYGTGIRNRSSLANVMVTINGVSVPVLYAGPQPDFAGLDQVNVELPFTLAGTGVANIVLVADRQTANTITVNVR